MEWSFGIRFAILCVCLLGCGGSSSAAGQPGPSDTGDWSATCNPYCDHAAKGCGVAVDTCLVVCKSFLSGQCSAQWKAVFECGTTTPLTCDDAGGAYAHPYGCTTPLANAGDCMFPRDAGSRDGT
jgi:hypothetical protein